MAVVMLLGAFPFDHARQHEGAVDDEALDLWCAPDSALEVHHTDTQCRQCHIYIVMGA